MYTKVCPTCSHKSFSSCSTFDWECPVCATDLTLQYASVAGGSVVKRALPFTKQLTFVIKSSKINQQI
ncbi:hypothetical protein [Bacillus sp. CHD6a]|uniref:hypothetical protein n=1 Tax=Bacillus sp. CHD6a TaxID=1643452 RepID=UPI0006CCAC80|nr:hypothetical protein [Bacillus sp. CHD6a]KPB04650.1 hypothetical protein AAV98_10005 [Bacillus sp. CHD6a]